MKINLFKLLEIFNFLNEHEIFTTIMSCIISLPITIYILDGFKYSENSLIHRWQKYNNVFVIILLLIFLIQIIELDTVYAGDVAEDKQPHEKAKDINMFSQ